jgi:hypothetical protein
MGKKIKKLPILVRGRNIKQKGAITLLPQEGLLDAARQGNSGN